LAYRQQRANALNEKKFLSNIESLNEFIKKLKKLINEFIESKIGPEGSILQKKAL